METVYFKGNECHTCGNLPSVGSTAPDFSLVTPELKEVGLSDFPGKKIVLNIFPSLGHSGMRHIGAPVQREGRRKKGCRSALCVGRPAFCSRTILVRSKG